MNEQLRWLDTIIYEHLQHRRLLLQQVQDAFTPLGNAGASFRSIFAGVEPPIKDVNEFIEKAGGPDRLVTISFPDYGQLTFALLDILDAVEDLEGYFPIESLETFVKEIQTRLKLAKNKQGKRPFPGWGRVPTRHLKRILEQVPPANPLLEGAKAYLARTQVR